MRVTKKEQEREQRELEAAGCGADHPGNPQYCSPQSQPLAWRRFRRGDWDGFSGCTHFDDGSEPLILEWMEPGESDGLNCAAIIDRDGIQIHRAWFDGTDTRAIANPTPGQAANVMFILAQRPTGPVDWQRLGFEEI